MTGGRKRLIVLLGVFDLAAASFGFREQPEHAAANPCEISYCTNDCPLTEAGCPISCRAGFSCNITASCPNELTVTCYGSP